MTIIIIYQNICNYTFLLITLLILIFIATGPNKFKPRGTSNVLLVMSVSGNTNTSREPAVALISPAGSSAPPQPATEPDTSTANTKPHALENGQ